LDCQALLKGVSLYQKLSGFDISYKKYVLDRRQIWENLDIIAEDDVKGTAIEFLKAWKIRNVSRIDSRKLKEILRELSRLFKALHDKRLMDIKFEEINTNCQGKKNAEIIKEIYAGLVCEEMKGIGPTSASKIMHCVIPELFVMWDNSIRNGYGYANNEIGYLRFMREMQRILRRIMETYDKTPEELCHEAYPDMNKTPAKLLDEFNYMKFAKGKDLPNPIEES